ncbi:MAG: hypothetical protein BGO78_04130 [Chloroflexi bacterium 44-23]|nr:MAG: hypothetical protein BGO78_04130 [Chloroflexi bacterium 44-23]
MQWNKEMNAGNQFWQVVFDELPTTLDVLRGLPQANLQEPYYAAALLIPALCHWSANKNVALDIINYLKGPHAVSIREIQFVDERLQGKAYLPFSYFEGATPENGYEPSRPFIVKIFIVPTSFNEAGYAKLYLKSSGADSPRPVQLRKKTSSGEWFLWEQMLLSEIRPPVSADPWQ